jgi:pyruvate dehydrogenase E1 component
VQPPEPEGLDVDGLLRGIYRYRPAENVRKKTPRVQLLASGVAMPWALQAQELLSQEYGVAADVWSVTSWNELAREAVTVEKRNFNRPSDEPAIPYVTRKLADAPGPVLAVSDYMRAVPDQIARWVPGDWHSLGADGFGFADTRAAARRHFQIDAESIVVAALAALATRREVEQKVVAEAFERFRIDDPTAVAGVPQEGADA